MGSLFKQGVISITDKNLMEFEEFHSYTVFSVYFLKTSRATGQKEPVSLCLCAHND